jgi:hypothetical protein
MAGRPYKQGLDYFSLDTDIEQDPKVEQLIAEHPEKGFEVFMRILLRIYGGHGYFIEWTPKKQKLFSSKINVDSNSINAIINTCLEEGLFRKDIFERHGILTSKSIQTRYVQACHRREKCCIVDNWLLIEPSRLQKLNKKTVILIYDDINSIFVNGNLDSEYISLASKEFLPKSFSLSLSLSNSVFNSNRVLNTVIEPNREKNEEKKAVEEEVELMSTEIQKGYTAAVEADQSHPNPQPLLQR